MTVKIELLTFISNYIEVFTFRPFEELNSATGDIPSVRSQGWKVSAPPGTPAGSLAPVVSL